ncbi:ABC transporter ATP-binding protein [Sporosarcina oncorhynchi]|uniref:ABC transporter ATP-binding protein n=1 Tax=Sporosarcina oncorhynchi TaxID=3056444 RepID=A0ABZ0L7T2_9BACL|nr:ABC transporter ATP-binding protein [Sporosarcina sp. T2O-4]WOV88229.1 ABC transporter ATP-binding protein [Sporosarcina sp. T2O-4]
MTTVKLQDVDVMIEQKKILHGISFEVGAGEFIGLIGPNGSGKSTLLKTIASLQPIASGKIHINGKEVHDYKPKQLAKVISYVPQDTTLDFDFTVEEIVKMGRHVHGSRFSLNDTEGVVQIEQAMRYTGIIQLRNRSMLSLSGGQRQLVFIAKALAQETPIILLDEPISALDIRFQLQVLVMLKALSKSGKTVVVVLHDLNLASRFCTKLLLLNEGRTLGFGTTANVLRADYVNSTYKVNAIVRKDDLTEAVSVTALSPDDKQ